MIERIAGTEHRGRHQALRHLLGLLPPVQEAAGNHSHHPSCPTASNLVPRPASLVTTKAPIWREWASAHKDTESEPSSFPLPNLMRARFVGGPYIASGLNGKERLGNGGLSFLARVVQGKLELEVVEMDAKSI